MLSLLWIVLHKQYLLTRADSPSIHCIARKSLC
uniref:Uncharacterized protein n=1 Tax=Setaria italica TaxID=4555 RepID=K4AN37_SETIT